MISSGERILNIIKSTTEYNIPTIFNTVLRARIEMITEGPNSNLIIIFEDRTSSSELSNVPEDFESMTVNNNDIKEPQLKKRKRNKYHYTEDVTHGFQSNITNNKKMDIIKYIQLLTQ